MPELVLREDKDGLATLTLNRPDKLNALNVEMFIELRNHVDKIASEIDRVGAVVVRGAGKCFSAGHDLIDIAAGERPPKPNFQADTIEALAKKMVQAFGGEKLVEKLAGDSAIGVPRPRDFQQRLSGGGEN